MISIAIGFIVSALPFAAWRLYVRHRRRFIVMSVRTAVNRRLYVGDFVNRETQWFRVIEVFACRNNFDTEYVYRLKRVSPAGKPLPRKYGERI